ncbi:MAG: hypothetical protein RL885_20500 [Planctomycetota bacterium]
MTVASVNRSEQIGRAIGWKLELELGSKPDEKLTLSHRTHYAHIEVSLPGSLVGGSARIMIEALGTPDYQMIAKARQPEKSTKERPPIRARLTLFWRDRVGDEPSVAKAPVTTVLAITSLSRVAEGVRVKTILEGRDWIYEKLSRARLNEAVSLPGPVATLKHVLKGAGLQESEFTLFPTADSKKMEGLEFEGGTPVLDVLERVGERLAEASGRRGRSLFLIRDGALQAGIDRPIPYVKGKSGKGEPYSLKPEEGLIRAESQGERHLSTAERRREAESGKTLSARDAYLLTLAGRPDVKPGDVVKISVDASEAETGFGLPNLPGVTTHAIEREVYVHSVQHRLGKNAGWVTLATGVTVTTGSLEGVFDVVPVAEANPSHGSPGDRDSADPKEAIVHHIRHQARTALRLRERPRVGEVRANHAKTTVEDSVVQEAAQSLDVFIGLEPPDGQPRRARRQEIRRVAPPRENIPYLTPFAWGPFGLVLPHYPGERVLVDFHEDSTDDPVVVGALWRTADAQEGNTPPTAEPGDWWLILPANLDASKRSQATGTEAVVPPEGTKAVHDLIDATGARVIELQELTIRAKPADQLGKPQERPTMGAQGGILITHSKGATIHIGADGKVTIDAPEGLKLTSKKEVSIEGSAIELKAANVNVVQ